MNLWSALLCDHVMVEALFDRHAGQRERDDSSEAYREGEDENVRPRTSSSCQQTATDQEAQKLADDGPVGSLYFLYAP